MTAQHNIVDIAMNWVKAVAGGKGIKLDAGTVDLLNAAGIGESILALAASQQREQCQKRSARNRSISADHTASMPEAIGQTLKSSGMTQDQDAKEHAARALEMSKPGGLRLIGSTLNQKKVGRYAQRAGKSAAQTKASS